MPTIVLTPPAPIKTTITEQKVQTQLSVGQGPAGAPGETAIEFVAAEVVSGHMAVALRAPESVGPASCDQLADSLAVVGVSLNAALAGSRVVVTGKGEVEHSGWSWTPNAPVFLGLNGQPTQVLPPEAVFLLVLGVAITPTLLLVNPQPPIQLA